MDKIVFTSKNGECPFFIAKGIIFFIKDNISSGKISYILMYKRLEQEVKEFNNYMKAYNFIIKDIGKNHYETYLSTKVDGWETYEKIYSLNRETNKVIIKNQADYIGSSFDRYTECLTFAKEHLKNLLDTQLDLFCIME